MLVARPCFSRTVITFHLDNAGSLENTLEVVDSQYGRNVPMKITRATVAAVTVLLVSGYVVPSLFLGTLAIAQTATATSNVAVAPQYSSTHVYVAPTDFDRFVASVIGTFGGTALKKGVFSVTPTPSKTISQLVLTPVGTFSVFGFETPIPYPFGSERTGYLVTDLDLAVRSAHD